MLKFESRKAAWCAMIIRDHLNAQGLARHTLHVDGTATFRKHGAVWYVQASQSEGLTVRNIKTWKPKAPTPEVLIVGSAQQFAMSGDEWNAHNPQHDAWRPLGQRVRMNAFGDICHKPTIEGFDQPYVKGHDQAAALARVLREEQKSPESLVQGRLLCNARVAYRKG